MLTRVLITICLLLATSHGLHQNGNKTIKPELKLETGILPYRPIATNRIYSIRFTSKLVTLRKAFNIKAQVKYFNQIIVLWSSIFMENQLTGKEEYEYAPGTIDKRNPECRDLRSIIMDEIKTITDAINANFQNYLPPTKAYINHRRKRNTQKEKSTTKTNLSNNTLPRSDGTGNSHNSMEEISTTKVNNHITKRGLITTSIIKMMGSYMAKKGIKRLMSNHEWEKDDGLLPIGGTILSYAFGLATSKNIEIQSKKIDLLTDQFLRLQDKQENLVNFANLTQIIIEEMSEVINIHDHKIMDLFNKSNEHDKIHSRSILCLHLYTESAYLLNTVKTIMNNFIMADTLIPKGNKNLFSEKELNNILSHEPDYRLATGRRNLWHYSLFNIIKKNNEWIYEIQVPLTNIPTFSIYKISPFPIFPKPLKSPPLIIDIQPDTIITLSKDDKYFMDNINPEQCIFSDTHGVCPGPIGLIDTDFGDCAISIMLFDPKQLYKNCKFIHYKGHFPRIATSMGRFLITSTKRHEFVKSCGNERSAISINPGTNILNVSQGCSLNETDLRILNPIGSNPITSQKLDSESISLFKIHKPLPLAQLTIYKETTETENRIKTLEAEHEGDTVLNEHIESFSLLYISLLIAVITLTLIASTTVLIKFRILVPIINSMQKIINIIKLQKTTLSDPTGV